MARRGTVMEVGSGCGGGGGGERRVMILHAEL